MGSSSLKDFLEDSLALEAVLKESSLDQEVAERIALWKKGRLPIRSKISPSLSKVMDIMKYFTAEDTIDNIRKNNPKNFQSEIEIQKLPTEMIDQIFEIFWKDFQEMRSFYVDSRDEHSGSDAYCGAICLGLTCRHYWATFSRKWCHAGTNIIIHTPPPTPKMVLALLLETWVGPEYRISSRVSWVTGGVPMFLSRELYGSKSTPSTAGLHSRSMTSYWRGVLSPFGMGEAWYIEAARQFCTGLDCCLVTPVLANEIIESPDASWRNFRDSHLYNWAHSQELSSTSKFQENIKEWLGSYEKSFEERHGDRRFNVHKGVWTPEFCYIKSLTTTRNSTTKSAQFIKESDKDKMNDPNSVQTPNVTVDLFNDSRVSNAVDLTGLKRKFRAEDSDDADVEEDTIELQKLRRKIVHLTNNPSSVPKGDQESNLGTFPHGEASSCDSAGNFYDNSALMQVETSKRESTEENLGQIDYASKIDDAKSDTWRNKDSEDEKIVTPSIIQRKTLKTMAESTSFLPNEVVVKIFEAILRLPREPESPSISKQNSKSTSNSTEDEEDSDLDIYTNGEISENLGRKEFGTDNDEIIEAICFALTCPRYWIVFRDVWCYSNTNKIIKEFGLSMPQELVLAPLLETWMGEKYRRSNLLTINPEWSTEIGKDGSQGYINMFLSRSVYGQGDNERDLQKEQSLWDRYKARSQILDCSEGYNLEDFIISGKKLQDYPKIPLPSPFRMGSSWYLTAAKQYRDMFISWQFRYSDYDNMAAIEDADDTFDDADYAQSIGPHSCAMQRSWESFWKSAIFEWVERIQSSDYSRDRPLTQVQDESLQIATDILELYRDATQFDMITNVYESTYDGGLEEIFGPFLIDKWETYAYDVLCFTTYYGHNLWEPELPLH
ncbi:hypothetical protein BTUL_0062g00260 [Botrytis tulipae]|uniref:Uncharacterized protein n=1 Tax=Botrytis tulipae TaxID=87230 RepID=A0A4Z1ESR5_9HELO|nr:hypothetical protein BTUL_0062g00260 [Botrytis tulipae]